MLCVGICDDDEKMRERVYAICNNVLQEQEMEERLPKLFLSAIRILGSFVLIDGRINSRDVVYVKTEHIYSRLRLKDGTEELLRCTSREMEQLLQGTDFIRISRSVLVNV